MHLKGSVSGMEVMRLLPQDCVICRSPCFSSLESLLRLQDEAKNLQNRLISGLSRVYDSASVAQSVASSSVVPSPKRPCLAHPNRLAGRQLFCHESNDVAASPVATVSWHQMHALSPFVTACISLTVLGDCQHQEASVLSSHTFSEQISQIRRSWQMEINCQITYY